MKTLVLNGSMHAGDSADIVWTILLDELNRRKWEATSATIRDRKIAYCTGCFGCWVRTPGVCKIDDDSRDISRAAIESELVVLITPVTFGGYSSELKKVMDRSIPLGSPFLTKVKGEVHHKPRYRRYPSLLGLGTLPKPNHESERIFKTLVERNAINCLSPRHASGIILGTSGTDEIRGQISRLLQSMEDAR